MEVRFAVIASYFAVVLAIGLLARSRWKSTPDEYFLAGRGLGGFVLLGTMAATNFSAFTVFGASGAGYRDGYAFFPIVGFGTGFMALTFWLIGKKTWELGKTWNLVSPAELVALVYRNRTLSVLFAAVMIVFTVPYLALQPMAGGYVLQELFGIPHSMGATFITAAIVMYTFRGGLKAVAWTDVFQGLLMVLLMITALFLVASHYGGLEAANEAVRGINPELMARPGGEGRFGPELWFSFLMLWFFCDPMFPQLFQRFFSANNLHALRKTMLFYPAVCTVVFFLPVTLGVFGHISFPGLSGKEADRILPLMLTHIGGDFLGTLIMSAGLAALMSTMDSQLLTLSSIFSRDVYPLLVRTQTDSAIPGRIFVVGLAAAGLLLAMNPPASIIQIATQTFTGLAVLFPTVLFGLYSKKPQTKAAVSSILVGEAMVLLSYMGYLPTDRFLPAAPILAVTFLVYIVVFKVCSRDGFHLSLPSRRTLGFSLGFGLVFLLSVDWWQWRSTVAFIGGFPLWMAYFVALSAIQTVLMKWWIQDAECAAQNP